MNDDLLLPLLYDVNSSAGWHAGMEAITRVQLGELNLPHAPSVLEVGCGSGAMLSLVSGMYPAANITCIDLNSLAVSTAAAQAPSGIVGVAQANMLQLPFAAGEFDLILALDSMDQRAVPLEDALAEAARLLRPGGHLLLRVSAYPWLYGAHDRAFGTGRRYTAGELRVALGAAGYSVTRITYANLLLGLPVAAIRLMQRERVSHGAGGIYASAAANTAVRLALQSEARWLRVAPLPFGLSLLVNARKGSP